MIDPDYYIEIYFFYSQGFLCQCFLFTPEFGPDYYNRSLVRIITTGVLFTQSSASPCSVQAVLRHSDVIVLYFTWFYPMDFYFQLYSLSKYWMPTLFWNTLICSCVLILTFCFLLVTYLLSRQSNVIVNVHRFSLIFYAFWHWCPAEMLNAL